MFKHEKHYKILILICAKFLGIDKALQTIQCELVNNTSKINKRSKKESTKLKEVPVYPTYSEEQKQLYKDRRLDNLNTEKQAKLEILSQNRKDLQMKVDMIKETIEKVFDKFYKQSIAII